MEILKETESEHKFSFWEKDNKTQKYHLFILSNKKNNIHNCFFLIHRTTKMTSIYTSEENLKNNNYKLCKYIWSKPSRGENGILHVLGRGKFFCFGWGSVLWFCHCRCSMGNNKVPSYYVGFAQYRSIQYDKLVLEYFVMDLLLRRVSWINY